MVFVSNVVDCITLQFSSLNDLTTSSLAIKFSLHSQLRICTEVSFSLRLLCQYPTRMIPSTLQSLIYQC